MTEIIYPSKVKIGGLWENKTKTGIVSYSGDLSYNSRIEFWPNKKRDGHKAPDFNMFIVEKMKKIGEPEAVINDFPPNDPKNVPF